MGDGVPRIFDFFIRAFDIPEEYHLAAAYASLHMFTNAVWRAWVPGRPVQAIPVLAGHRNVAKSFIFEAILPDPAMFSPNLDLRDKAKEFLENTQGYVIVECQEIDRKIRSESHYGYVKSVIRTTKDKVRMAYKHFAEEVLRGYVVVATANGVGELYPEECDDDGRGFMTVVVEEGSDVGRRKKLLAELRVLRDQYWAEAVHYVPELKAVRLAEMEFERLKAKNAEEQASIDDLVLQYDDDSAPEPEDELGDELHEGVKSVYLSGRVLEYFRELFIRHMRKSPDLVSALEKVITTHREAQQRESKPQHWIDSRELERRLRAILGDSPIATKTTQPFMREVKAAFVEMGGKVDSERVTERKQAARYGGNHHMWRYHLKGVVTTADQFDENGQLTLKAKPLTDRYDDLFREYVDGPREQRKASVERRRSEQKAD